MTLPDSDIRTSALIVMAQAISNRSRRPQHWMDYIPDAIYALDALNAALPGLGIKMVPLAATEEMNAAANAEDELFAKEDPYADRTDGSEHWKAMLAASTNPLEKPE